MGTTEIAIEGWKKYLLGDILNVEIDANEVEPTESYRFAGVYGFGKGIFKRGIKDGKTSYKVFNRLHKAILF